MPDAQLMLLLPSSTPHAGCSPPVSSSQLTVSVSPELGQWDPWCSLLHLIPCLQGCIQVIHITIHPSLCGVRGSTSGKPCGIKRHMWEWDMVGDSMFQVKDFWTICFSGNVSDISRPSDQVTITSDPASSSAVATTITVYSLCLHQNFLIMSFHLTLYPHNPVKWV